MSFKEGLDSSSKPSPSGRSRAIKATAIGLEHLLAFDLRSLAQLAIIAGTISYAFAGIWARKRLTGLAPEVAAAGMLTGSTLIMLPAAWIIEGPITLALQTQTWLAIGYYVVIATALAYLLYYRILALAGSGNLMLVTLLVPPIAIVLGAVVLGETLHPRAYLGFGVLALGLVILDGRAPNATLLELFTEHGAGSLIRASFD